LGRKVTAFSDLSGAEVPEDELGRLVSRLFVMKRGGACCRW
jgi:hypothetical protein